jgi:solute carrier family 25 oxoglutarate transporter 11
MKNFAIGGFAGMLGTCIWQPVDMIKVRVQVSGEAGQTTNPFKIAPQIAAKEGMKGFYKGLDSALVRQATYTTTRFGIFLNLMDYVKSTKKDG